MMMGGEAIKRISVPLQKKYQGAIHTLFFDSGDHGFGRVVFRSYFGAMVDRVRMAGGSILICLWLMGQQQVINRYKFHVIACAVQPLLHHG
jgi:hypothetical protein